MTKDEILGLIRSKIAGQGSAVDSASALPAILVGILELIPTAADIAASLTVKTTKTAAELVSASGTGLSKAQVCTALGIATGDLDSLFAGEALRFSYDGGNLALGDVTPALVTLGDEAVFSVTIEYDDAEGTYDLTAEIA